MVSSSLSNVEIVPKSYVFTEEERPGSQLIPICEQIPVIHLGGTNKDLQADSHTVQQILKAAQDFGFFQVINHGVPENIISDTVGVLKEFLGMAEEDKARAAAGENTNGWIYSSSVDYANKDGVHLWRDNIKHICHPLEDCMQFWPPKPPTYREVVAKYMVEMRKLSLRILEMIAEGLGLEPGYFEKSSEVQLFNGNYYPPCPDPSLTLGLLKHTDPSLITILFQGEVCGLQVFKDGQWIGVGAIPNAFVVNIGNQLEIISNGKLKSAEHRAVTNPREGRTTMATFVNPPLESMVEPAKALVNELNPARYQPRLFKDFVQTNKAFGPKSNFLSSPNTTN
ncbi:hypothetical protein LguiB_030699 [Lonicera macranthoides]